MATLFGVQVGEERWGPFRSRVAAEQHGAERATELGLPPEAVEVFSETQTDPTPRPQGGVR